jgi:hypothetical protein
LILFGIPSSIAVSIVLNATRGLLEPSRQRNPSRSAFGDGEQTGMRMLADRFRLRLYDRLTSAW